MHRHRGKRRSELATGISTNKASTHRPPRVLWHPSCLCAGPYFPLYPRYQGPRPLLHLHRARNMTLYLTLRSRTLLCNPAPEALPPPAPVQGMRQFMGVYRHRALPLPAKAGDAHSTSGLGPRRPMMVVEADDAVHSLYRAGTQTPDGGC